MEALSEEVMMAKSRWQEVPMIDFHAHVVLHEREDTDLKLNTLEMMLQAMAENNVERAVILPINHPEYFPLSGDERKDWLKANNDRQAELMRESGGKFIAFADCALDGRYRVVDRAVEELERAVRELGLSGLKIHPSNLKIAADDPRLGPLVESAGGLGIPVLFHSNPTAYDPDFYGSSPSRIHRLMYGRKQPYVIAHLGGISSLELLEGDCYVDFSGGLLGLSDLFGVEFCERLLRRIGLERVLFGTDYPIFPYERYFEVLDRMDFTEEEVERIAYKNAARLLKLES
jgi:predicted TIM-barrel fold metal-dependent hydrolase